MSVRKLYISLIVLFIIAFGVFVKATAYLIDSKLQQKLTPSQQIQQLKAENLKLNILLSDAKGERNAAVIEIARLTGLIDDQRNGIIKSQNILQEAIDKDEKVDYEALNLAGWDLVIPADNGKKSKGNSRP